MQASMPERHMGFSYKPQIDNINFRHKNRDESMYLIPQCCCFSSGIWSCQVLPSTFMCQIYRISANFSMSGLYSAWMVCARTVELWLLHWYFAHGVSMLSFSRSVSDGEGNHELLAMPLLPKAQETYDIHCAAEVHLTLWLWKWPIQPLKLCNIVVCGHFDMPHMG